jgi:hypothetical protein
MQTYCILLLFVVHYWATLERVAMVKKKFDEQTIAQWIQLRRKGESYHNIGSEFHVDPRTIKSWIQRAGEEKEKEHWEAVSRQVDAKYLDEHYRMLLQTAAVLLDAVHTDPVSVHHELDVRVLLDNHLRSAIQKSSELLASRGLNIEPEVTGLTTRSGIKDDKSERLGRRLLNALMEHEPELNTVINTWESAWADFQQERLKLIEIAKSLFEQRHLGKDLAKTLKIPVVQQALTNKLLNEPTRSSKVDDIDGKKAHLICYIERNGRIVYTGPNQEVEVARKAYDWVLSQVSHQERIDPVKKRYISLIDKARQVEDYIDHLVLTGKPMGKCVLCLGREIHLA